MLKAHVFLPLRLKKMLTRAYMAAQCLVILVFPTWKGYGPAESQVPLPRLSLFTARSKAR